MIRQLVSALFGDPFLIMNTIGLVAFALVGSAKAIREEFDLFGVVVVGLATAFVGGVTRDLLVNRLPLVFQSPTEISLGLLGSGLAVVLSVSLRAPDEHDITVVSDAIGLAAFTTTGAIVATEAGLSGFGIVAIGTINAVGGGAFADILLDRSPFILFDDFYASCAVLGGCSYWLVDTVGVIDSSAAIACATVTVSVRVVAVTQGWYIPTVEHLKSTYK